MPTEEELLKALTACASGGPCEDCYRQGMDDCVRLLIEDAAEMIDEYLWRKNE